jgi:hypothetical protein
MPETDDERLIKLISAGVLASVYSRLALRYPESPGGFNKLASRERMRVRSICRQIVDEEAHGPKPAPRK